MKKDMQHYVGLLATDSRSFIQQPDKTWRVFYKKLPNVIGRGVGISEAELDLAVKAVACIEQAIANGAVAVNKNIGEPRSVVAKPCPFCGGKNITVDIAGCEGYVGCGDCGYDFSVGDIDFDQRTPVENQAKKLWNNRRPIERAMQSKIAELQARIDELEKAEHDRRH